MARTKQRARMPKPLRINPNTSDQPLPHQLIDGILSLPADTPDDRHIQSQIDAEPPTKRLKSSTSVIVSHPIGQGVISFSRQCTDDTHGDLHEERHDIGRVLRLSHSLLPPSWKPGVIYHGSRRKGGPMTDTTGLDGILRIGRHRRSQSSPSDALVVISPANISPHALQIINLAGSQPFDATPGAIWTRINVLLEKSNRRVSITFQLHLFWNETPSPMNGLRRGSHRESSQTLIDTFYRIDRQEIAASSPLDFYNAAYVPPTTDNTSVKIDIPGLEATLYPYQEKTLKWLLGREGVQITGGARVISLAEGRPAPLCDSSRVVKDLDGREVYLNDVFQTISTSNSNFRQVELGSKGGILAEEMGLGKTLEILALVLLHRRPANTITVGGEDETALIPSGATLIVTPESLRQQWLSEISRHAPRLRCTFYQGCKREGGEGDHVARRLAECDVVITTYAVLTAELHFTTEPSSRPRRHDQKYDRPKSPLIQVGWWRLCLDEAQMVESSMSQASKLARVIPRENAWAITGTPVKDDVEDLYGLLLFLGYQPLAFAPHLWRIILKQKPLFQNLFNVLALRHTKALVRDEISLPPQHRYVISVPFTAVEEQHYQSLYRDMAEACEVDLHGNPIIEGWDPEEHVEDMRAWLNRLRQTALHPEVGAYGRRLLGQSKNRPMRTVEEVLVAMLEQSEIMVRSDERALLSAKLTRGQLLENSPRVREALLIWEGVKRETEKLVANARVELQAALAEVKGKETIQHSEDDTSEDESDDAGNEGRGRVGECRRKLRSNLEMLHRSTFFCANAFFQIKDNAELTEPDSEEFRRLKKLEDDGYENAKVIRRELLGESHKRVTRLMSEISRKASEQQFAEIPELLVKTERGIESGRIIDNLEVLYGELNDQANAIDEWREAVIQLLLKPLLDEEDEIETTGEELMDSAKIQDELMVYVQALRAVIADRLDAMSGQTNELIKHETQASLRMAKEGEGPAPQKLLELMEIRTRIKPQTVDTSMRAAISEFRSLGLRLGNEERRTQRVAAEHTITLEHLKSTQTMLREQSKVATALETEIERFSATMNARLEYYRQLQSVSDSVLPYDGAKTEDALQRLIKTEEGLQRKLASGEGKHRYLIHLKEAGSKSHEPRMCVICQTPFEVGVLTVCGHQFCKECMTQWYKAHRNCPVCKRQLATSDLHDITIRPQELKIHSGESSRAQEEATLPTREQSTVTKQTAIYSAFNVDKLAEIKNVELEGPSYTTKVDTLVRHLLWLRESDPGAKSIVFSQYKDFLGILASAFKRFRIGFASVDNHGGTVRFKEDPATEVFLLHARAHSSGLNLVNASHVFLCEPLVNTAIELQAIARVDRIGQLHETTVWLYITAGTVEESIYNLSVQRRMQHMGDSGKGKSIESTPELLDANLEAANTLEMEQAPLSKLMSRDKTAGELVNKGDLWECLFGHVKDSGASTVET